ncbi:MULTISPECIES: glycosyltransferase [Mycobacterium avium complex (MAC)]|uniref:Glycosyl transferase family 1 n=1 Tax=Mycobacterium timonense TaxID=701043 RepID=A0ABX3THW7_9MYCO|nr:MULTISPECIES: glycosyltransferase [Mycobacterium avium complex (MAC)]MDV3249383.1 glycosyltransferase [Mycobacterium avium subsp. hominissuis]MDV3276416.1 glycosyltransferase [Mycobacterium avium subsp. hominissuis]MDV3321362.1 glycosyltransferase [Mycobacterium avium subsp. hominissuis]ORB78427.1 glycosyl transferase family 1 [Mycobacterium timonense]
MKFVLASYGSRGDIEPSIAVGGELLRRGHEVSMAVPPDFVGFAESMGLPAVAYGPYLQAFWDEAFLRGFWPNLLRNLWTIREPIRLVRELWEPCQRYWAEMSQTLTTLCDQADLLFTGLLYQELAASVAEHYEIPFVTLHYFPVRPNGQLFRNVPSPLLRSAMTLHDWFCWRMNKRSEDAQRGELGLPKATQHAGRRITESGALEIQAYDKVFFPRLEAEWARWADRRPFIGALTLELSTDNDDEIASWIRLGSPPICFAMATIAIESPVATMELIAEACAQLGERALVCVGGRDFSGTPSFEHVKLVGMANYRTTFPACRAVVHHGGSGTTAAGLRAGIPTLILWTAGDQPFWAASVKRLKVGTARRFAATTCQSLVADLRRILTPEYVARARDFATHMTNPRESAARAACLVEQFARVRRVTR